VVEVYVARQPILNNKYEVFAYELLYRGSKENNYFPQIDGDKATADVVFNSYFNIGLEQVSEGKSVFVNFTENLLKSELPLCFPPDTLVIEVLENIKPTQEIVHICKLLKERGFRIALDDYILNEDQSHTYELVQYADIIKVDIQATSEDMQQNMMKQLESYDVEWLAEKVETYEEYQACAQKGYTYFQGYFFSRPVIMTSYDVSVYPFHHLELIKELSQEEPDIKKVAQKVEMDVALSFKLLQLINSAAYRRIEPIKSIEQAIVLLGLKEVKKWAYVLTLRELKYQNTKVPSEVIKLSFMRAKMGELIANQLGKKHESSSYFLTGMLSCIDTFMQRPIQDILEELPLHDEIKNAIKGEDNAYRSVLQLCQLVEKAKWDQIEEKSKELNISTEHVFKFYKDALEWTQTVMETFYKKDKIIQ